MRVVVAGSSGLIGTSLTGSLRADGHEVLTLVRHPATGPHEVTWSPTLGPAGVDDDLLAAVSRAGAVVNLAGAGVAAERWTPAYQQVIRESRVTATRCLAAAIAASGNRPPVLVSGSAGGYYGDTGPVAVDETGPQGTTFLATVCAAWEKAADEAREAGVRVVHARTGTVADPDGGAFGRWLPVMRLGAGGRLGSGRQWWSLISLRDEVAAIRHCIDDGSVVGPVNLAAPEQATNADVTSALGAALHRPTLAAAPRFALRAVLGDFADELLIDQRMAPAALLASGFTFRDPTVRSIVASLVEA